MQIESKIRMQLCALFSQLHHHVDALEQAKKSVKLTHLMIKDMFSLCDFYVEKNWIKRAHFGENSTIRESEIDTDISSETKAMKEATDNAGGLQGVTPAELM